MCVLIIVDGSLVFILINMVENTYGNRNPSCCLECQFAQFAVFADDGRHQSGPVRSALSSAAHRSAWRRLPIELRPQYRKICFGVGQQIFGHCEGAAGFWVVAGEVWGAGVIANVGSRDGVGWAFVGRGRVC